MAKYDDLVARIEKLEGLFALLDSVTQFRSDRDTKDLRELERIVDGLKRQVNGVSKQANKTEESLSSLTREVIRIDGSNDMRREDIAALREEQSAQAFTQLGFGKRLAALESFKDLAGNNFDFLKSVQVEYKDRLEYLERKETERRQQNMKVTINEAFPKTLSWREVVDKQEHVPDDLTDEKLKGTLFYHLSRIYAYDKNPINALARIIALVEKNKGLTARDHRYTYVQAVVLARAIVNDQWQAIADIAARMLSVELAE